MIAWARNPQDLDLAGTVFLRWWDVTNALD
jgi:hypothetical protein